MRFWTILLGMVALTTSAPSDGARALDEARQAELRKLVREECTQCHGPGRIGGEGPSLLPSDIKAKDKDELVSTILNGRDSRMPPWYTRLSPEDVRFIVEHILPSEPEP